MARFNAAYRCLLEASRHAAVAPEPLASPVDPHDQGPLGRRLTHQEVDAMVAAMGSSSWIEWIVDATPGGPQLSALFDWLLEPRRLGSWRFTPAAAMACALSGCYVVLGALVLSGVDVHWGSIQPIIAGSMVVAAVALTYATRHRD